MGDGTVIHLVAHGTIGLGTFNRLRSDAQMRVDYLVANFSYFARVIKNLVWTIFFCKKKHNHGGENMIKTVLI